MTHTIHVFTATRRARAALTGTALPQVAITHLAGITLAFAFVGEDGETIGALGGSVSSARCVVKALPTSDVLLLDSTLDITGTGTSTRYNAVWDDSAVDSSAMRTFLADEVSKDAYCEVEWTIDGDTARVAFPITILAAFLRPADTAPDPAAEDADTWLTARAVRFDAEQTLTNAQIVQALANLGIRITAGGYIEFTNSSGDKLHVGLNTGTAPE